MPEETNNETQPETTQPETTQPAPAEPQQNQKAKESVNLLAEVAETLKSSNDKVRNQLRDILIKRKLDERVEQLDKGMKLLAEVKSELNKFKPDVVTYDQDGKKLTENWTKDNAENRKKALEKLKKVETAVELAFEGNFDKLRDLVK
jgi:hypothetical protein